MTHVQGFDSPDDMFAAMNEAEDAANADLTPGQIRLRDDVENTRYWVQAIPDWDLVIYGVAQPNHVVARSADFDVAENRSRGYLTGTAYSADLPEGEYGDKHVSEVVPISGALFVEAQRAGWPRFSALRETEHFPLAIALATFEQAARS